MAKSTLSASAAVFAPKTSKLNPHAAAFVFSPLAEEPSPAIPSSPVCQAVPQGPISPPVSSPSSHLSTDSDQKTRTPSTPTKTPPPEPDTLTPSPSGKIFYSRQQLLEFRDRPECQEPPEAAVSDLECLRQFRSEDKSKGKPQTPSWRLKKVPPPAKLTRTPSTGSKSASKDAPLDINVAPLAMTENRYVVRDFEGETKQLRLLNGILNKLTPESFDNLLQQVLTMGISTLSLLTRVVDSIFEKALSEPPFCAVYAEFCEKLAEKLPPVNDESGTPKKFKTILLNQCQVEFEKQDLKDKDGKELSEADKKKRRLGTIVFIGELYVRGLLKSNIMFYCFKILSDLSDEEDIEASCKLLRTVGKTLEKKDAKQLAAVVENLKKMATTQVSSRIRFMVQDVVDLQREKWVERIKALKATKLSDVRKDGPPPSKERALKQAEDARRGGTTPRKANIDRFGQLASPRKPATSSQVDNDGFSAPTPKKKDKRATKQDSRVQPVQKSPQKAKKAEHEDGKRGPALPGYGVLGDSEEDRDGEREERGEERERDQNSPDRESDKSKDDSKEDVKEEQAKHDADRLFRDFLRTQDFKEARECLQELKPSYYSCVVEMGVLMLLEENQQNAGALVKLLRHFAVEKLLTAAHFENGLIRPLECLEDILVDCPLGLSRLAALMAPLLTNAVLPVSFFNSDIAMNLRDSGLLGKWVGLTFAAIEKDCGNSEAAKLVQKGQLKLGRLFKSPELYDAFLRDHQDLKLAM